METTSLQAREIAKVLGYYEIGGVPTLLDPRIAASATVVHEQTHRDNINSSYYGYVATRCLDLSSLAHEQAEAARRDFEGLMAGAWHVLEGAAVCADYATRLVGEPGLGRRRFAQGLPSNYRAAFDLFRPFVQRFYGKTASPAFLPWMIVLLHGIAEVALDLSFLRHDSLPASLATWRGLACGAAPDRAVGAVVGAAAQLTFEEVTALAPVAGQLAGDALTVASRQMIVGVKRALLKRLLRTATVSTLADDHVKAALVAKADAVLREATPGLLERVYLADRYAGFSLSVPIQRLPTSLPFHELSPAALAETLPVWDADERVVRLAFWGVRRPDAALYDGSILPIVADGQRIDVEAEYGTRGLTLDALLAMANGPHAGKLVWFNRFVPDVMATPVDSWSMYDAATLFRLTPPPYVFVPSFNSDWLRAYCERRGRAPALHAGGFEGAGEWVALRASFDDHHLFWLLSGLDIGEHERVMIGEFQFERAAFSQDEEFSAIALAAFRGWGASHDG